jgi:hypothetical protein
MKTAAMSIDDCQTDDLGVDNETTDKNSMIAGASEMERRLSTS